MGVCWAWQSTCEIDWPAWVQAVGSIIAILAAIWIANREARLAEQLRVAGTIERVEIARFLSYQLLEAIAAAETQINQLDPPRFDSRNFDSVVAALKEVPLIEMPRGRLAISVLNQRRAAEFYQRAFDLYVSADRTRRTYSLVGGERDGGEAFVGVTAAKDAEELRRVVNELARLRDGAKTTHREIEEELTALFVQHRQWLGTRG